jgi:hypothetical protein
MNNMRHTDVFKHVSMKSIHC